MVEDDYYAALGVEENATHKEIKKAYRDMAMKWHPDKNKDNPDAVAIFLKIAKAHEILINEDSKATYDASLHSKKLRKRKDSEMSATRKKMKEDLERRENEEKQRKEEVRRAAKVPRSTDDDMSWLNKNKPFRMPKFESPPSGAAPGGTTRGAEGQTTIQVKWSRKKQFTQEEVMQAFQRFGDVDLVVLKDKDESGKGRPSALVSFKSAISAQAAMNSKTENFKVQWPTNQPTPAPTPTPPKQPTSQPHTPQSPYTFTSPFGTAFPYSPAGSPFGFASPFGNTFTSAPSARTAEQMEDFEMQTLLKLRRAAQAQKEQTPTSTPDKATPTPTPTPDKATPTPTPTPTPTKSTVIDVDNPTSPPNNPIDVDASASTPIDVDNTTNTPPNFSHPADFESVTMMKMRRAAERQKLLDELQRAENGVK